MSVYKKTTLDTDENDSINSRVIEKDDGQMLLDVPKWLDLEYLFYKICCRNS